MKKYINKLFEWLGYVPKEEYALVLRKLEWIEKRPTILEMNIEAHERGVKEGKATYHHITLSKFVAVLEYCYEVDNSQFVKVFPYHDEDSKDYARICAEELCEMLNEKY
jgi:hypothetical protein